MDKKKTNFLTKRSYKKKINKNWKDILHKADLNSNYEKNIKNKVILLSSNNYKERKEPNLFDYLKEKEITKKYKLKQIFLTKKSFLLKKYSFLWKLVYKKLIKQFVMTKKLDFLNIKTFFIRLFYNIFYDNNYFILFTMNMSIPLNKIIMIKIIKSSF